MHHSDHMNSDMILGPVNGKVVIYRKNVCQCSHWVEMGIVSNLFVNLTQSPLIRRNAFGNHSVLQHCILHILCHLLKIRHDSSLALPCIGYSRPVLIPYQVQILHLLQRILRLCEDRFIALLCSYDALSGALRLPQVGV